MCGGLEAGRELLAWQAYRVLGHVAGGDAVVTRLHWTGELAVAAGGWPAGSRLTAWCVAHYRLRNGRIAHIEQHDCYEEPPTPDDSTRDAVDSGASYPAWHVRKSGRLLSAVDNRGARCGRPRVLEGASWPFV